MSLRSIHKSFVSNQAWVFLACFVFILLQIPFDGGWTLDQLWPALVKVVLGIGVALLLLQLNQQFVIIKSRTALPALFYLLFLCSHNSDIRAEYIALSLLLLLSLFFLFRSYQDLYSQGRTFVLSLFISLGSLLWFPFLLVFPVIWYGMSRFQSLSFRSFFATLLGFVFVYLLAFSWSVWQKDLSLFVAFFPQGSDFFQFGLAQLPLSEYIFVGFIGFVLIFFVAFLYRPGTSEKIRTKLSLEFLFILSIVALILSFIFPAWEKQWTSLLFVPLSFLYAYLFTLSNGKKMIWLFLFTLFFLLLATVFNAFPYLQQWDILPGLAN